MARDSLIAGKITAPLSVRATASAQLHHIPGLSLFTSTPPLENPQPCPPLPLPQPKRATPPQKKPPKKQPQHWKKMMNSRISPSTVCSLPVLNLPSRSFQSCLALSKFSPSTQNRSPSLQHLSIIQRQYEANG